MNQAQGNGEERLEKGGCAKTCHTQGTRFGVIWEQEVKGEARFIFGSIEFEVPRGHSENVQWALGYKVWNQGSGLQARGQT